MLVDIPNLKLHNPLNGSREHWGDKRDRLKRVSQWLLTKNDEPRPRPPCVITMTRVYSGPVQGDGRRRTFRSI